jgi:hypothetical protein
LLAVPELTRNAGIQLNERASLRHSGCPHRYYRQNDDHSFFPRLQLFIHEHQAHERGCQAWNKADVSRPSRAKATSRKQLARRQAVPARYRRPASVTLRNDPLLLFQCPASPRTRRNHLQAADLRHRRMTSHTPMSSHPARLRHGGARRRNICRKSGRQQKEKKKPKKNKGSEKQPAGFPAGAPLEAIMQAEMQGALGRAGSVDDVARKCAELGLKPKVRLGYVRIPPLLGRPFLRVTSGKYLRFHR